MLPCTILGSKDTKAWYLILIIPALRRLRLEYQGVSEV
jgi:hypothetical protein